MEGNCELEIDEFAVFFSFGLCSFLSNRSRWKTERESIEFIKKKFLLPQMIFFDSVWKKNKSMCPQNKSTISMGIRNDAMNSSKCIASGINKRTTKKRWKFFFSNLVRLAINFSRLNFAFLLIVRSTWAKLKLDENSSSALIFFLSIEVRLVSFKENWQSEPFDSSTTIDSLAEIKSDKHFNQINANQSAFSNVVRLAAFPFLFRSSNWRQLLLLTDSSSRKIFQTNV